MKEHIFSPLAFVLFVLITFLSPSSAQTVLFNDDFNGVLRSGNLYMNTNDATANAWRIDPRNQQFQGRTLFAYSNATEATRNDLLDQPNIITQGSETFVRLYAESYYRHTVTITEDNQTTTYGPGSACRGDQIRTVSDALGNAGYFGPPTATSGIEAEARLRVFPANASDLQESIISNEEIV